MLGVLLRHEAPDELLAYDGVQASLEGLLPYTGEWAGPGGGQVCRPHSATADSPRSSPRAALPAAQPDAAGSHLPGLPVAQHEASHSPCGHHGPRGPLKHGLCYLGSLCPP